MGFKNWTPWIKGGFIGFLIIFVLGIIPATFLYLVDNNVINDGDIPDAVIIPALFASTIVGGLINTPADLIFSSFLDKSARYKRVEELFGYAKFPVALTSLFLWVGGGILIGLLIGKRKSKKEIFQDQFQQQL